MRSFFYLLFFVSIGLSAQEKMPNITIKDLKNKPVNISKNYGEKDKVYVFSFWATWCAPCIRELEAISENYDEWTDEVNMELIAISIDDARTQRRIRPLLNGRGWPYKVLIDDNQELKRALSIVNIPYTIIVKNHKIVKIVNGYSQGAEAELFETIKTL
ncbi:TlpA family protein disulfide reductase [Psychroflexus halocasei]|uniref:Peroxiredoxin n=1 Tax=Psychroflexus halocasei TaxID=908615 RepID=A0A1H4CLG3_9FLAO|nr:TlpA disulfide reductase family protein [Psychroflexus halocasei]SEA61153.1 Peroxiredoxin [Psychroflexus halocasei]